MSRFRYRFGPYVTDRYRFGPYVTDLYRFGPYVTDLYRFRTNVRKRPFNFMTGLLRYRTP
jgi:hypothetical protein